MTSLPLQRDRRRRLCLLTDSLNPSGVGQHVLALASDLSDRYAVTVACPASPGGERLLAASARLGLEVHVSPPASCADPALLAVERCWLSGFDVVHVHAGIAFEGSVPVRLAREAGVGVVLRTEHQPYLVETPGQAEEYAVSAALADQVVCVSEGVAATFLAAGVPAEHVTTVRNGVPRVVLPDPAPVRTRLGLEPGVPVILTPARFSERKGYRHLLAAASLVVAADPLVSFLWAGSGPTRSTTERAVDEAGLGPHVRFLPGDDPIADLLSVADLLVLPSLFEGMPLVVLEAMSASVPVVATDVCGTNELVEDGLTGRLVPAEDGAALAAGILDLLSHPTRAASLAASALEAYDRSGTSATMASATADVYGRLLARSTRDSRALAP